MTRRQLALAYRPQRFSEIIGQDVELNAIKQKYAKGVEQPAWLFTGETGTGKTTTARILALSLQCRHGEMGEPCDKCQLNSSDYAITEINASHVTTKEEIGAVAESAVNRPFPPSRRRVFILDEVHKISAHSQNLLLKYWEEVPLTTVWMACTTDPLKLVAALRRRCAIVKLKLLGSKDIEKLVKRALKVVNSNLESDPITEALLTAKVQNPGLILNGVEEYLAGKNPADAVANLFSEYNTKAICRALMKGDWDIIREQTKKAEPDELRGIRAGVAGYLRSVLEEQVPGPRAAEAAAAIGRLALVDSMTDATQGPATVAALYELTQKMGREGVDF